VTILLEYFDDCTIRNGCSIFSICDCHLFYISSIFNPVILSFCRALSVIFNLVLLVVCVMSPRHLLSRCQQLQKNPVRDFNFSTFSRFQRSVLGVSFKISKP